MEQKTLLLTLVTVVFVLIIVKTFFIDSVSSGDEIDDTDSAPAAVAQS